MNGAAANGTGVNGTAKDPAPGRRAVIGMAVAAAGIAAVVVPIVIRWDRLPDPLATHWNLRGVADGSMSRMAFTVFSIVVVVACMAWVAVVAVRSTVSATAGISAALAAGVGAILGGAAWSTVVANTDRATSHQAGGPAVVVIVVLLAVALGVAALVGRNFARDVTEQAPEPTEPLAVPAGVRAAWIGRCTSPLLAVLSAVAVAVGLGLIVVGPLRWVGLVVLLVGVVVAMTASIVVRADRTGVTVVYGPLPLIHQRIRIERIASASAIDVTPMRWGGWGYRGSMRVLGRAAVVLRAGPGLHLELIDRSVFVVTVDDPQGAAAVINHQLIGSPRPGSQPAKARP